MSATVVPTEVAAYLAAVRAALDDLGAEERDDLLVEVEASLIETAGEDDRPIAERLGPPEDFAAELRSSAGLAPAAPAARSSAPGLLAAARAAAAEFAATPRVRSAGRGLRELAPIWWLARGYVAFVLVAKLAGADWSLSQPAIPRIGGGRFTVVVLGAVVAGSIALGLRGRRGGRPASRPVVVANLILALAAVPAAVHVADARSSPVNADQLPSGFGLASPQVEPSPLGVVSPKGVPSAKGVPSLVQDGAPVLNIYPYTRDGRLLHDVLLFDQNGQPLDVMPGDTDPTRRLLTGPGGQRIFDSFPIRYFDPGTRRVARPNAAPPLAGPSPFTPAAAGAVARRAGTPRPRRR